MNVNYKIKFDFTKKNFLRDFTWKNGKANNKFTDTKISYFEKKCKTTITTEQMILHE